MFIAQTAHEPTSINSIQEIAKVSPCGCCVRGKGVVENAKEKDKDTKENPSKQMQMVVCVAVSQVDILDVFLI